MNVQQNKGEIVIYQTEDGQASLEVSLAEDTVWLDTHQMANLFQRDRTVVVRHIRNIYKTGELLPDSTCAKIAQIAKDGKKRVMDCYIKDGGPRKEISEIPLEVLREGLVNATVHRDYYEEGVVIDAFYRLGITEKIGSGITRMHEAMAERGIEIMFDIEDFFIATLTRPETIQKAGRNLALR